MPTPSEIFAAINEKMAEHADAVQGVNAVYQFDLSGGDGGLFHIVARDGDGRAGDGPVDGADTTIAMATQDFLDLFEGRLDPTMAFMSGKLKITGDYGAAMKLQSLVASARR